MKARCGSQTYLYVPFFNVTVQVFVPLNVTLVSLLTPGPVRWKLWLVALSLTVMAYLPGLSVLTFLPPLVSVIVVPGPTDATSLVVAAPVGAATTSASATVPASVRRMRFTAAPFEVVCDSYASAPETVSGSLNQKNPTVPGPA